MRKLLVHFIFGFLGLYLATLFIPGVEVQGDFTQSLKILILAGIVLGLVNFFLKPIINIITFPLRLITLGLFGLIINMAIVWIVDVLFPQLLIEGLVPLFWTGLLIWTLGTLLSFPIIEKIKGKS